ncbi:hypothetical protein M0804_004743, partial [Polistes exclamans]
VFPRNRVNVQWDEAYSKKEEEEEEEKEKGIDCRKRKMVCVLESLDEIKDSSSIQRRTLTDANGLRVTFLESRRSTKIRTFHDDDDDDDDEDDGDDDGNDDDDDDDDNG